MAKYLIQDNMSDYSFEIEMSDETYEVILNIKNELDYLMEDVSIEEI